MESKQKVVKYTLIEDGIRPGQAPWGAAVRAPVELSIEPGHSRLLRLGVSFDAPFLVFSGGMLEALRQGEKARVDFPSTAAGGYLHSPSTELQVLVTNISEETLRVEEKSVMAHVVFFCDQVSIEKR